MPFALLEEPMPELSPWAGLVYGFGLLALSWWLVQRLVRPRLQARPKVGGFDYTYTQLLGGFLFYFAGMLLIGGLMFGGMTEEQLDNLPALQPLIMTAAVQAFAVLGVVLLVQRQQGEPRHFGLSDPRPVRSLVAGLAMYACCIPAFIGGLLVWKVVLDVAGYTFAQQDVAQLIEETQGAHRYGALVLAGLLIPFLEEFLFRGFVQNWMVRLRGALPGIWITSIAFAALHGVSPFGYLLMVALAAGFVFHWTGSLWAAFAVHAANNTVNVLLLYFAPEMTP